MSISATMEARKSVLGRFKCELESTTLWSADAVFSAGVEFKLLLEDFHTAGKRFDALHAGCVAEARRGWNPDRPLSSHFYFRLDNVYCPVSPARGYVSRKSEIREC